MWPAISFCQLWGQIRSRGAGSGLVPLIEGGEQRRTRVEAAEVEQDFNRRLRDG